MEGSKLLRITSRDQQKNSKIEERKKIISLTLFVSPIPLHLPTTLPSQIFPKSQNPADEKNK